MFRPPGEPGIRGHDKPHALGEFSVPDIEGESASLSDLEGNFLLLSF
jgi:hypothetical protein